MLYCGMRITHRIRPEKEKKKKKKAKTKIAIKGHIVKSNFFSLQKKRKEVQPSQSGWQHIRGLLFI